MPACPHGHESAATDYCDVCGLTMEALAPPGQIWTAVITASRSHYETVLAGSGLDPGEMPFPDDYQERQISLTGDQLRIGRRSVSREVAPEIDLTGPPSDPAISRLHAVLVAQPDGSWAVIDPGSANGISVNGTEIDVGDLVPLHNGDCICVGAWTVITIMEGSCD